VPCIASRALHDPAHRQLAIGVVGLDPARQCAGDRDCRRPDTAERDRLELARLRLLESCRCYRASAAVEIFYLPGFGVVDQLERITDERPHMRVKRGQGRACGQRGINGRSAGTQHIDARGRGEVMGRGNHSVGSQGDGAAGLFGHGRVWKLWRGGLWYLLARRLATGDDPYWRRDYERTTQPLD
jgi:hypothetical protein